MVICKIDKIEIWPQGYKTFLMFNSTEHEISITKTKMLKCFLFALKLSDAVFILLINVKMPSIYKQSKFHAQPS